MPSWAAGEQVHFEPAAQPASGLTELGGLTPSSVRKLEYWGGPVEYEPKLFLIFWGKNWTTEPGQALKTQLVKMYESLKETAYQKILTQYDSPEGPISLKPDLFYTEEDNSIAAPTGVNNEAIHKKAEELRELTGSGKNMNDQYVVLPAPGSTYAEGFDTGFCAYHKSMGNEYGSYDFVPYEGDAPFGTKNCTYYGARNENNEETEPSKHNADYATSGAASHEYAESATDPTCNGWTTEEPCATSEEIADLCVKYGKQQMPNGAWVNELWDDSKGACELEDESPTLQEIPPLTNSAWETTDLVEPNSAEPVGAIEPCGLESHYFFEWGKTESLGKKTTESTYPSDWWGVIQREVVLSELEPGTTYYWHIVEKTSDGTVNGKTHSFTTPYRPAVKTKPATSIRTARATFNGTVDPEGYETKYYFEYGSGPPYETKTAEVKAGSGKTTEEVGTAVTGLSPSTAYYYRIAATNTGGTGYGAYEKFTTPSSAAPFVETKGTKSESETGATVEGTVDPENAETKYYFEYGPTTSYGSKTAEASAGSGTANVEESKPLTGLTASSTYHYRVVATNSQGTTDGADKTFSTTGKPTVETRAATGLISTGGTLNGTVNPRVAETKYYFEYGPTTSYGSKTAEASAGAGSTSVEVSKEITGLTAKPRTISDSSRRTPTEQTTAKTRPLQRPNRTGT